MNKAAERHIDKAAGYLARGEAFYRKAAEEILNAQQADSTLSNREIGERFGRSAKWVRDLVAWHTSGETSSTPYAGTGRPHQDQSAARKLLREAPLEQVESLIAGLPKERQEAIAVAAGHGYLQARRDAEEERKRETPEEQDERDREHARSRHRVNQAVGTFTALGIIGHLEQATEELRELSADASLTPETARRIDEALEVFMREFSFARAMLGEEGR